MWVEPGEYRGGLPLESGPPNRKGGNSGVRTDRKWIQVSVRRSLGARRTVSLEGRAGKSEGSTGHGCVQRQPGDLDVAVSAFCSSGRSCSAEGWW